MNQPVRTVPFALWLLAFLQGAAVLVVEVLGARMLTPYFGTSHFVWTAQITLTLLALALGYVVGGRVPTSRRDAWLRGALLACGGYLAITPWAVARVAYASYRFPLAMGALATSVGLFGVPLAALATLSPCLVAAVAEHKVGPGQAAGRVAAVSTAGSVFGVLVVAYLCIPYVPTSYTMYGTSALVVAASLLGTGARAAPIALLSVVAGAAAVEASAGPVHARLYDELSRTYSPYSTLQVWRRRGTGDLSLSTNYTFQNDYDPVGKRSADAFVYVLDALTSAYAPRAENALVIGLGVGLVPRALARRGVQTRVFELDPAIPGLAERHFDADLRSFEVEVGDGRVLLALDRKRYDVIVLDAFHGDSTPSHLLSREAFAAVSQALDDGGVLVANMWTDVDASDRLMPVVLRTLRSVFRHVRVYDARIGNYYVVAAQRAELVAHQPFSAASAPARIRSQVDASLATYHDVEPTDGLILTDDYNPADTLASDYYESVRRASAGLARPQ